MAYFQHYYTSAKSGFGGVSGFQTYSASSALTEQDIEEIEKYSKYNRPDSLPAQPDTSDMAEYPKAFTFFKLPSGKFGIAFTQYTGKDYSGRFGNSFSHAIVRDENEFPFYPFEMYGSPDFKHRLTEAEENSPNRPEPLPELDNVRLGSTISIEKVQLFLQKENRLHVIKQMINIVLSFEEHGRRILIVDENEHVPMWLAALQMAFPINLAHQLTFSSYTYDPLQSNAFINATLQDGTSYRTNGSMLRHQFHVFDVHSSQLAQAEKTSLYTEFVASQLVTDWESLQPFYQFLAKTNFENLNGNIDGAVSLYKFMNGIESIGKEELRSAIMFAHTYCNSSLQQQIVETLRDSFYFDIEKWKDLILELDLELAESISSFLFSVVYQTKNPENSRFAFKFFFDSFNQLMLDASDDHSIQSTITYFKNIKGMNHPDGEFQKWALGSNLKDILNPLCTEPHEEKIKFFISSVFQHLKELHAGVEQIQKDHIQFLLQLLNIIFTRQSRDHYAQQLLKEFPIYTERFLLYLYNKYSVEIDRILLDAIEKNSFVPNPSLHSQEYISILKRLCEQAIVESRTPAKTLATWYENILNDSAFSTRTMAELIHTVIQKIEMIGEKAKLFDEADTLLNSEYVHLISKASAGKLVISVEQYIPLNERYKEHLHLLNQLNKVRAALTIPNQANIHHLLEFGELLYRKEHEVEIKEIVRELKQLSPEKYKEYMRWIVPLLAKRNGASATVIQYLAPVNRLELFWLVIENVLEDKELDKKQAQHLIEGFFTYYLHVLKSLKDEGEPVYDHQMIDYLKRNKSIVKKLDDLYAKKNKFQYQQQWDLFQQKVFEDRNLFSKMKNIFSSKK